MSLIGRYKKLSIVLLSLKLSVILTETKKCTSILNCKKCPELTTWEKCEDGYTLNSDNTKCINSKLLNENEESSSAKKKGIFIRFFY